MTILQKVESHVVSQLTGNLPKTIIYHNLTHTRRVVNYVKELIENEGITGNDAEVLEMAAWFHDIGHIKNPANHEKLGAEMAQAFLQGEKIAKATIVKVQQLILVTTKIREPENLLEKIMLDADCAHIGNKGFSELSDLLREEWEQEGQKIFTDSEWIQENINFLSNSHQYYTDYAIANWQAGKDKNLAQLYKAQKKARQEEKNSIKKEELKLKKKRASIPERGIETMFRVTLKHHITLSNIADTKANILL